MLESGVLRSLPGRQPTTTTTTSSTSTATTAHLEPLAVRLQHSWAQSWADRWGGDIMSRPDPATKHSKPVNTEQWLCYNRYYYHHHHTPQHGWYRGELVLQTCAGLTWHPLILLQPQLVRQLLEKQVGNSWQCRPVQCWPVLIVDVDNMVRG